MRRALLLSTTILALTGAASAGPDAMTAAEARHLIARTGFGAAPHEIAALTGVSYRDGIARIIGDIRTEPVTPMPAWTQDWIYPFEQIWVLDQTTTDLFYANRYADLEELSAWWIGEMVATPSPLTERLVLFWSDHFATSFEGHENGQWSAQQNAFFRANAAGNFTDLAEGILHDPSVLEYLDNVSNVKDAPNENLGREYLELFTLGEGRGYDQSDVVAAAQILTGYTVDDVGTPRPMLEVADHDMGAKTLFGQTGNFGVDDLAGLTLANPEFGPYIVEKLWLTFVSDTPDPAEVARLTAFWKANDLELKPLLKALFLTDAFWDVANRGRLVKSPLEMVAGTTRTLGMTLPNGRDYAWMLEDLGQMPFLPPNVGGWPEGVEWINDATASGRATILTYMLYEAEDAVPRAATLPQPQSLTIATDVGADDFRVGQVFAPYLEVREEGDGLGGLFVLYDVGFQGQDWRSITFWLEHPESGETGLYIFDTDCAPVCFASAPRGEDEPRVVPFEPAWFSDAGLSDPDKTLLQAIGTHLPALIETTAGQLPYRHDPDDPDSEPADIERFISAANAFAAASADAIGTHEGALVLAFSRANPLGVSSYAMMGEDRDDAMAMRAAEDPISIQPSVTYATARDWIDALPGTGSESERAAAALLAVPRMSGGQRDALVAADPEAMIRSLILSPAYQVK